MYVYVCVCVCVCGCVCDAVQSNSISQMKKWLSVHMPSCHRYPASRSRSMQCIVDLASGSPGAQREKSIGFR